MSDFNEMAEYAMRPGDRFDHFAKPGLAQGCCVGHRRQAQDARSSPGKFSKFADFPDALCCAGAQRGPVRRY